MMPRPQNAFLTQKRSDIGYVASAGLAPKTPIPRDVASFAAAEEGSRKCFASCWGLIRTLGDSPTV
jgi:hypothetical protein